MEIKWTFEAIKDLKRIHAFYKEHFSSSLAQKISQEIITKVKALELGVNLGQKEPILEHLKQEHRYLISRHNKIIYRVDSKIIYITHVFDTRQNPNKLK